MRFLLILATVVACYFIGDWLLAHPGEVQITWFGYEIVLHIAVLGMALIALMALVATLAILIWRMVTWPSRRRARKHYRRFKKGLDQLTRGVAALAMGNEEVAEEAINKAMLALPGEALPQLLTAQLLQRQGKHADAQAQFRALLSHSATAELATRRLIEQHIAHSEWREAIKLAEESRKTAPRDRWLVLTLIDLYAREKQTAPMLALTEGWQWQSPLTKDERNRYAALAYYLKASKEQNPHIKEKDLRHAVGYAPEFLPAIIDYAYVLLAENAPRRARKWLLAAWKNANSSLLIPPILAALSGASPRVQQRLLQPFLRGNFTINHQLLIARHALSLNDAKQARLALEAALAVEENKEAATLLAELERKLRNDEKATALLNRAVESPPGPGWICQPCGTTHQHWQSHCTSCEHFDTLRYERPEARLTTMEMTATAPI